MRKLFILILTVCIACVITACAYRNDLDIRYTINCVIDKADETDDAVTLMVTPVMYEQEWDEDAEHGVLIYYGSDYYNSIYGFVKLEKKLSFTLEKADDYEEILKLAESGSDKILRLTLENGKICGMEETGYRYEKMNYVYDYYY